MATAPDLDQREMAYLNAMAETCQGDPDKQVSMYDVGESLGLDRDTASQVCQELIAFGLVEIRTLSGGVGLTATGVAAGGVASGIGATDGPKLKAGPLLDDEDRQAVTAVLDRLKHAAGQWQLDYDQMTALVIDIKTIETQLLAPQPKTAIIKAVCESLVAWVQRYGDSESAAGINTLTGR
jgi:hypothetical protein